MNLSVINITPEIAVKLLAFNTGNRPLRRHNVNYWKSAIIGNAVSLTHQGIAIAGTLDNPIRVIDGQHRLLGIAETGISVKMVVCENAPEDSFMNLDNGMTRSLGDRAGISSQQAQMANVFYYLSQGGKTVKAPVRLIQEIHETIHPFAVHVVNKHMRSLSLTPIRAAFVLQQRAYKTNMAEEFQNGEFGVLPESLNALYRRQSTRPFGIGGGSNQQAAFCATWRAIRRPSMSKIYAPASPLDEAAEIVHEIFPEIHELVLNYRSEQPSEMAS